VEAAVMDRRWQLVLDCLDCADAPFSPGTLVAFRERLIAADLDRRLIERTVEIAAQTKGFGHRKLRAALDSSPLWGAGRVEDTYNLLGHALRKAIGVLARQQGRELAAEAAAAGTPLLGAASLKAALDCDWDDPAARAAALEQILGALAQVEAHVAAQPPSPAQGAAQESVAVAQQVVQQDVEARPNGTVALRQGVAPDRRISVEDPDRRHGRKSRACGTGARVARSGWMATSGTCCATWTVPWCASSASRRPTLPRPACPRPWRPTWHANR
jgi:transposase